MDVPYINLISQHSPIKKELLDAISSVIDSGMFILGENVAKLEEKMAKLSDCDYAIGVNSGTDALKLAMKALRMEGKKVCVPANSFLATASSVVEAGAVPHFCDVKSDMNIDPAQIPDGMFSIPVHLTGRPAQMDEIKGDFIEDCAQSINATFNGQKVGSFGLMGCFSLHPLKNLSACGDAGMITTSDDKLALSLKQLRNIGLKNRDEADVWGVNSRLDEIQAAILLVKLKHLPEWEEKRRETAKYYNEALKDLVEVPLEGEGRKCVYHTYIIQTDRRDELMAFLKGKGIDTKVHYPIPIHKQKAAAGLGEFSLPVCERQAKRILSLPVYPELTGKQIDKVVEGIKEWLE